ncbi:MAG TPA: efflux RND transporter permease subunit [Candidatus Saccharimonadaceae bacterium]|jgi:multidrug efflux pump|nr:efflux RND transporter permease subunit [Candidatus Saccharimonadaceae bacterium]
MKLSELSIRRPVLATVMSLTILLFGALSFTFLPVREYPDIDSPVVSITTSYRGASPQVVETEITDVLEEQLSTIEGVKLITSSSQEQVSSITIEFNLNRDVDKAANDVRDRVSRVRGDLPPTVDEPVVAKQDVNAQPIIWLALSGKDYNTLELSDVAYNVFVEKLQRLNGVGAVEIGGNRRYAMRVWLDPQRLAAYHLTVADVENALRNQNAEIPSGRIEGKGREFSVHTRGDLVSPEEFSAIVVSNEGNKPVHLSDVADVHVGAEDDRNIARYNLLPAVGLGIVKQQKASTVDVAHEVKRALPSLRKALPPGMLLDVAYDSSTFIDASIHEVVISLLIAVLLVFVVIFVFLGSLRATLIPAVAIPVSVIGTFTVTYALGFSLNILTLLALVLAIGLVVDDAIVMLENVHRHMEMGKSRMRAALDGADEIGFAILATTIALVAVFVPVAFLTGRIGRLFNEFGIAVAVSVLISGFVALTLTPMLCSRILRVHGAGHAPDADEADAAAHDAAPVARPAPKLNAFDRFFQGVAATYERSLRYAVTHRGLVMAATVVAVASIFGLFKLLPRELTPQDDQGWIFTVVRAPEGSTLEYTDKYTRTVEAIYQKLPAKDRMFTAIGLFGPVTDGFMFVGLKPQNQRLPVQVLSQQIFPQLMSIPGVLAFAFPPPGLGGGFGGAVQYVLQADSYEELARATGLMMQEAQKLGYLVNMDSDLKLNKPQLEIDIDRERAAELGVSVADIGSTLQTLLGGQRVTRFKRGNHQYEVMLQVPRVDRSNPSMIDGLYVRGTKGLVQLASVTHVREDVAPRELNHFNRVRSATLSASLAPGVTIGKALSDLDGIAKRVLPSGVRTDLAGESREFAESSSGLNLIFLIALVFIFLVLAAQFESFVHPMTILLSVPLAVFGALLTLFIFRMSINIYSQIGLIMLIGLVTKNGILIVEFANQRRARGMPVTEAVVGAATIRLRPILMTTLATIFGILPIALGLGAGSESRKPLGMAVVGGMVFSTALTLIVVPVVYTLLARLAGAPKKVEDADPVPGAAVAGAGGK